MALAYEEILARRITPDTTVPQHDFLFRWSNQPCYARGELVALTGKAKSGKTFVCSLLMALAVRSQIMGLSRLHDKPLSVVWIDTEQSEDSTRHPGFAARGRSLVQCSRAHRLCYGICQGQRYHSPALRGRKNCFRGRARVYRAQQWSARSGLHRSGTSGWPTLPRLRL